MNNKFKIVSLGCRTNQYEAEGYRQQLLSLGWKESSGDEGADLCVVNTCTVTEAADKQSRQEVKQFAKKNPDAKIAVTGCSVDGDPEGYLLLPGVKAVKRNHEKEELIPSLFPEIDHVPFKIEGFEGHTRAFVKVQDGCNSFCTYCIIPYVRGRSRSRTVKEVLAEIEGLVQNGFKEIVLTGINIGDFDGAEEKKRLVDLVRAVDAISGLERIRISSIDPDEVDEELTTAILEGKKTCPSLHLVLQSGSNVVLKRMNRKYTRQIFLETCHRLRSLHPDFSFTTDLIVGFPGETEEDHQESLAVIQEVGFSKVHMFPYSRRERTRAALYPNPVSLETIHRRKQEVLKVAHYSAFFERNRFIGRRMSLLVEGDGRGHTVNFLPVEIEGISPPRNTLVEVELIANHASHLVGKVV